MMEGMDAMQAAHMVRALQSIAESLERLASPPAEVTYCEDPVEPPCEVPAMKCGLIAEGLECGYHSLEQAYANSACPHDPQCGGSMLLYGEAKTGKTALAGTPEADAILIGLPTGWDSAHALHMQDKESGKQRWLNGACPLCPSCTCLAEDINNCEVHA